MILATAFGLGGLAVSGCPGILEDKASFVESDAGVCGDVPTALFQTTCARSGCHSAVNPAGDLDLQSVDVAARVVNKPSADCNGLLADPASPKESIIYRKLLPGPPCGSQMPLGSTKLSDAEIACVATWISDQAATTGSGGAGGTGGGTGGGGHGGGGGAGGGGGSGGAAGSGGIAGGSSAGSAGGGAGGGT